MSDRAALLQAILLHPAEDTPRFMFADWCEENDQSERAEFIRGQMQQAADWPKHQFRGKCRCKQCRLTVKLGSLLHRHGKEWCGSVHAPSTSVRWYRGFIETVEIEIGKFTDLQRVTKSLGTTTAKAMFSEHPITLVRLLSVARDKQPAHGGPVVGERFGWWRDGLFGTHLDEPDLIPAPIWDLMKSDSCEHRWKLFATSDAAHYALSDAAVSFGRQEAGLPLLPPTPVPVSNS